MKRKRFKDIDLWQFESLEKEPSVKHFVSGRDIRSENLCHFPEGNKEFTLSYSSTPDREEVRVNRNLIAAALGLPHNRLFFPSQVHKTRVVNLRSPVSAGELLETDALITNEKGMGIAVLAADCVPILLYDRKNKAVGAVHSGWRGTAAKILTKTLQEMSLAFGTKGQDLIACIGPSVCQESYEVGEEVVKEFNIAYGPDNGLLIPLPGNKAKADLWAANVMQLKAFGVEEYQTEIAGLCTLKNNRQFFSARAGDKGRFAAGIGLA